MLGFTWSAVALSNFFLSRFISVPGQTAPVTIPELSASGLTVSAQGALPALKVRYIITHRKGEKFPAIPKPNKVKLNATHEITVADLTAAQAYGLSIDSIYANFIMEKSQIHKRKESDTKPQSVHVDLTATGAASSPYLQAPMYCANFKPTNVRFVLLDTRVFPDGVAKGMAFYYGPTYVGTTPCNPHGTTILNELSTIIQAKYLNVTNVAIFNCGGLKDDANATLAWGWITGFTKANKAAGLITVVNYSWGVISTSAEQTALQAAINAGAVVSLAAGNTDFNICYYDNFVGAMRVGGTNTDYVKGNSGPREPGDEIAKFSGVGKCVIPFVPAYIKSAYDGQECDGTSCSAPFMWAQAGGYAGGNPTATSQQILSAAANSCVSIMTVPSNYGYPTCIKTKAAFCTIPKIAPSVVPATLFTTLKTTSTSIYQWYTTYQNKFCVNFTATTSNGASLTAYASQLGTVNITVTIGAKISGSSKYKQSMYMNGIPVNSTTTSSRVIGSSPPVLFRMWQNSNRFSVMYQNTKGALVDLLSAEFDDADMEMAGFAGNGITYRNGVTC